MVTGRKDRIVRNGTVINHLKEFEVWDPGEGDGGRLE